MKYILFIVLCVLQFQCPIVNRLNLNPNTIQGTEAKSILENRLSSLYVKDITSGNFTNVGADFMIPILAGINESSYYNRQEVERCTSRIFLLTIAIDQPNITAKKNSSLDSRIFPPIFCKLREVNDLIEWF